jgi:hypothetical protein
MKTQQTKSYKAAAAKCQGLTETALVNFLGETNAAIRTAQSDRAQRALFHQLFAIEDHLKSFYKKSA